MWFWRRCYREPHYLHFYCHHVIFWSVAYSPLAGENSFVQSYLAQADGCKAIGRGRFLWAKGVSTSECGWEGLVLYIWQGWTGIGMTSLVPCAPPVSKRRDALNVRLQHLLQRGHKILHLQYSYSAFLPSGPSWRNHPIPTKIELHGSSSCTSRGPAWSQYFFVLPPSFPLYLFRLFAMIICVFWIPCFAVSVFEDVIAP